MEKRKMVAERKKIKQSKGFYCEICKEYISITVE